MLSLSTTDANTLNNGTANDAVKIFLNHIAEILLTIALPLIFVGVIVAAYKLIMARGNPDGYKSAKSIFTYLITGTFFILFASIIVRFIYNLIKIN